MAERFDDTAKQVANTKSVADLNHLLASVDVCDREQVLGKAVNIWNESHPLFMPVAFKSVEKDGKHVDSLLRTERTFFGLGQTVEHELYSIEIPNTCYDGKR